MTWPFRVQPQTFQHHIPIFGHGQGGPKSLTCASGRHWLEMLPHAYLNSYCIHLHLPLFLLASTSSDSIKEIVVNNLWPKWPWLLCKNTNTNLCPYKNIERTSQWIGAKVTQTQLVNICVQFYIDREFGCSPNSQIQPEMPAHVIMLAKWSPVHICCNLLIYPISTALTLWLASSSVSGP